MPDCRRPRARREWCIAHGERVARHGDPLADRPVQERSGVILRPGRNGQVYRYLREPGHPLAAQDGYVAEHRKVAWDAGMFKDPSLTIHHINGDGLDNRPENLQPVTHAEHRRGHAAVDGTTNQLGHHEPRAAQCRLCGREVSRGDLCVAHATRLQRYGDPLLVHRVGKATVEPYVLVRR